MIPSICDAHCRMDGAAEAIVAGHKADICKAKLQG